MNNNVIRKYWTKHSPSILGFILGILFNALYPLISFLVEGKTNGDTSIMGWTYVKLCSPAYYFMSLPVINYLIEKTAMGIIVMLFILYCYWAIIGIIIVNIIFKIVLFSKSRLHISKHRY